MARRLAFGWRFGELLDDCVTFAKESQHVAAEKEDFGEWAKNGKGSGDEEVVAHLGCTGGKGAEEVIRPHGAEDTFGHGGLKVCGRLHGGVFASKVLPDAEVFGAPSDLL